MRKILLIPTLALAVSTASLGQSLRFSSDGFEAANYITGDIAAEWPSSGQQGWYTLTTPSGTTNQNQFTVQTSTVANGSQALTLEASGHSFMYMHLIKETPISVLDPSFPGESTIDVHFKFKVDSSLDPSDSWIFHAQSTHGGSNTLIFQWEVDEFESINHVHGTLGVERSSG